jgi:hypothetical protein
MSRNIIITYELNLPKDTPPLGLSTKTTHELAVSEDVRSLKSYYESIQEAIERGKGIIGEELTAWRDAVGNKEQSKESMTPRKARDDDDEEEGDDDTAET